MIYTLGNDKKSKNSKKKKNKKVEEVQAPAIMQRPGTYLRENGILLFDQPFKTDTVGPIVETIFEYNLMPEEVAPERINLLINSPGGRVDSCLMLLDCMLTSNIPVDTTCTGMAASCGLVTLMAGKHRVASSTAQLMSHQYSSGAGGKEHELYGRMKSFEQTSRWMEDHYAYFTGLSVKKIRKVLLGATDHWMSAEEALEFNIIDQILNPYGEE